MRIKKAVKWVLAAVILIMVAKLGMAMFGGFHGAHHHMARGFGHYGMRSHYMGGIPFIGSFLSAAFWIAVLVMVVGWVRKKWSGRRFTSTSTQTYPSYHHQADFLDEWEKNQMLKKENE